MSRCDGREEFESKKPHGQSAGFLGKLNFNHDKEVLKIGDVSAKVEEQKTVPQWIGGIAVLVGAGLVVAGAMRR